MKLTMQLSDLKEVLKKSQAVLRKESGFRYLRFDICEKEATITGIGSEANLIMMIPVIADEADLFLLSLDKLYQVLMKTEGDLVMIKHEESIVNFQCGKMKMTLTTMNLNSCSLLKAVSKPDISMKVNSEEFKRGVRFCNHVLPGIQQNVPFIIRAFLIELLTDTLRVTATDTRRIAVFGPEDDVTASVTIYGLIANVASDFLEGVLTIQKEEEIFEISDLHTVIRGKSPSGKYPMLGQFFKQQYPIEITCDRKELIHGIKLVTCFQRLLYFAVEKDEIVLTSIPRETGSLTMRIACDTNAEFKCCIDGKFLLDALTVREEDKVTLHCVNPLHPIYISGNDQNEVIMPINYEQDS